MSENKLERLDLTLIENEEIAHLELMYPNCEGNIKGIQIGLCDVRAADDIRITYDFDRDGWKIEQASIFIFENEDEEQDEDWQEVAFIKAWGREKKSLFLMEQEERNKKEIGKI